MNALMLAYHERSDHGRDGAELDSFTCNCRSLFDEHDRAVKADDRKPMCGWPALAVRCADCDVPLPDCACDDQAIPPWNLSVAPLAYRVPDKGDDVRRMLAQIKTLKDSGVPPEHAAVMVVSGLDADEIEDLGGFPTEDYA